VGHWELCCDLITGTFKSAGGTGGSGGENGGPGTIYVHKLPVENEDLSKFVSNRTLFIPVIKMNIIRKYILKYN
jgi:hypothetical protein